jgi:hypothetical protein
MRFPSWILLGTLLLPAIYLPTLATRFDFIDDGNLVYASPPMPLGDRLQLVWTKIASNYEHLGPFRPVLWAHWEIAADLLGNSEVGWRITRLLWCMLAAGLFLWLLHELHIPPRAALFVGAVALWNPYRNEIWTSLTLAEGVAMPYALFALVCARRAVRGDRPWVWDLAGAMSILMALGCKNVFAALVSAQILLRLLPDGVTLREGWRLHSRRALLLGLTLLAPLTHYAYFKLNWHDGQYTTAGPSLDQLVRLLWSLQGAVSLDFLGVGLGLALLAWLRHSRKSHSGRMFYSPLPCTRGRGVGGEGARRGDGPPPPPPPPEYRGEGSSAVGPGYRAALGAGLLLLGAGIAVYLPMRAISGRYTMPAVWGLDVLLAVLLCRFGQVRVTVWKRAAGTALVAGLIAVAAASVGKQLKFQARARLLWDALEWTERHAPKGARIAWLCGDGGRGALNVEEGVHFRWHLERRGRRDIELGLFDEHGQVIVRTETNSLSAEPDIVIGGQPECPWQANWAEPSHLRVAFWGGKGQYQCYLRQRRSVTS